MGLIGRAASVLALLALPFASAPAGAAEKVKFMFDWTTSGSHTGVHLAKVKGYFADAGLDVEVLDGHGGGATVAQVASGQIDIGWNQLAAIAAARSNGLPVISIAGFVRAGDIGMMIPRESGYRTMKDLEGKRIAYAAASSAGPFLDAFLKASGTSRDKFTVVNVDSNALISTFASGSVEGALSLLGFFAPPVEDSRPVRAILFSSVGIQLPGYGLFVSEKTLHDREEMLRKFVPAVVKSWSYIFEGHVDEAIAAGIASRPDARLDPKVLTAQLVAATPLFTTEATKGKPIGWQSEADWASTIKTMEEAGVVKPGSKPSDYFTNAFIPE